MKKRLTIVANDVGGSGGMETHLEELVLRAKDNYEVTVVARSFQVSSPEGVRFVRVPAPSAPAPLRILSFAVIASILVCFIRRDILHATGALIFNRVDISTVHFCHVGYLRAVGNERAKANPSWLRKVNSTLEIVLAILLERYVYRPSRARHLIAVSNRVKQELLENFPKYNNEDISVIPNGINHARFHPADDATALRMELGLPRDAVLLLFVGGDWPRKGLGHVVDAFPEVAREFPRTHLVVVGPGNSKPYLQRLPEDLRNRVRFTGPRRDVEKWFMASDLFVFPTSYETFSLVVHEAAACGCIVLSSQVGGVEDLIIDGVTGWVIEPKAASVGQGIRRALTSMKASRQMAAAARERALVLTWDHMFALHQPLYDRVQ